MQPGSLVGFGLVFVLALWSVSLATALALHTARARLRGLGAAAERRAAVLAAMTPPVLAIVVVAALVVRSLVGADHCEVHDHHAHLCLAHGGLWASHAWAVAVLAGVGATIVTRLVVVIGGAVRTGLAVARLRRVGVDHGEVVLADSPRAFAFVAGLRRPRIFASTAAWAALDAEQREAVLAHERAHLRLGDVWRRGVLELLLALGAPLTAPIVRSMWASATERLCDAEAAAVTGRAELVAQAMVCLCRVGVAHRTRATPGFTASPSDVAERVRAVLAGEPVGLAAARRVALGCAVAVLVLVATAAAAAEPLHHALETLLG